MFVTTAWLPGYLKKEVIGPVFQGCPVLLGWTGLGLRGGKALSFCSRVVFLVPGPFPAPVLCLVEAGPGDDAEGSCGAGEDQQRLRKEV